MSKQYKLTPGELMLMQFVRLFSRDRGWDPAKTSKKLRKLAGIIDDIAKPEPAEKSTLSDKDVKAIEQAENWLKEIMEGGGDETSPQEGNNE